MWAAGDSENCLNRDPNLSPVARSGAGGTPALAIRGAGVAPGEAFQANSGGVIQAQGARGTLPLNDDWTMSTPRGVLAVSSEKAGTP